MQNENQKLADIILGIWILAVLIWNMFVVGGAVYLIIWRGCSLWWLVLACLLGQSSVFENIRHRLNKNNNE